MLEGFLQDLRRGIVDVFYYGKSPSNYFENVAPTHRVAIAIVLSKLLLFDTPTIL